MLHLPCPGRTHARLASSILATEWKRLYLSPSSPSLAGAEVELVNAIAREYLLRKAIEPVADEYDYVLIDCPPSLGLLTVNALTAALDGVIVPVQCEYLALEGLTDLLNTIQPGARAPQPRVGIRGMLMTMYDPRTNLSQQVVDEVKNTLADRCSRPSSRATCAWAKRPVLASRSWPMRPRRPARAPIRA